MSSIFAIITQYYFVKSYGRTSQWSIRSIFFPFVILPIMTWRKNILYTGQITYNSDAHDSNVLDSFKN